ncbi:MAG TPA: ABC-2 family transporter protein [Actinoplanes sp.]
MTARLARLVGLRVRYQFLDWLGAWWFVVTLVVASVTGPLIGLVVWTTVRPGNPATVGYFVALAGVQLVTASFENHTFAEAVYDGRIGHDLLKPQPVVIGPVGENIAIRVWLAIFGLPFVAAAAVAMHAAYRWPDVLLAVPALLGAAVLRFLWTWLLALAAFWTERVHALVAFGNVLVFLLGGAAAPIAELPGPWRPVAAALPFHAMLGLPASVATGAVPTVAVPLMTQLGWCAVLAAAAALTWRAGVRRYTAVGG